MDAQRAGMVNTSVEGTSGGTREEKKGKTKEEISVGGERGCALGWCNRGGC